MFSLIDASDIFYICGALLVFVVTCIQCVISFRKRSPVFWLSLSYLMILGGFFILFLFESGLILGVPHLYKVGCIFVLLYMPFSYLYIRAVVLYKFPRAFDVLHLLPVLIFILDYAPFFLSSATYKRDLLENMKYKSAAIFDFSHGALLSDEFYRFWLSATPMIYWTAQLFVLINEWRMNRKFFKVADANWIRWLFFYLSFQMLILSPMLVILISSNAQSLFQLAHIFGLISMFFILTSVFFHPRASGGTFRAGGISQNSPLGVAADPENLLLAQTVALQPHVSEHVKSLKNFSSKQIQEFKREIEDLFDKSHPFLKHGYSLQEMASSLNHPLYILSAVINHGYGINFNELINQHRIAYAVKMIKEKKFSHLNINGLADRCGFNNRNTFTAAFKKFTGVTPSEFFKHLS